MTRVFARDDRIPAVRPEDRASRLFAQWPGDPERTRCWEVLIFPGSPGWSFIVTAPSELLCAPRPGSSTPRLLELTTILCVDACHVNVYDGVGLTVVECAARGTCHISGFIPELEEVRTFGGLPIQDGEPGFHLLELPGELRAAFEGNDSVATISQVADLLGGRFASYARADKGHPAVQLKGINPFTQEPWPDKPPPPVRYPRESILLGFMRGSEPGAGVPEQSGL